MLSFRIMTCAVTQELKQVFVLYKYCHVTWYSIHYIFPVAVKNGGHVISDILLSCVIDARLLILGY